MLLFRTYPMSLCCCHLTIVMLLFRTYPMSLCCCHLAVVMLLFRTYPMSVCCSHLAVVMLLFRTYPMSVCCSHLTIAMLLFTTPQCLSAVVASLLLCYCSQLLNVCMLLSPHYCHDIVHNSSTSVCCCRFTV